jgi:hypothetical protein
LNAYYEFFFLSGRSAFDAQRSSGNTNDLRGKILRIHPEADGTYSIPFGNLFVRDSLHRPEIYIMGVRNPFRFCIDPNTTTLYWADVGPNAPRLYLTCSLTHSLTHSLNQSINQSINQIKSIYFAAF